MVFVSSFTVFDTELFHFWSQKIIYIYMLEGQVVHARTKALQTDILSSTKKNNIQGKTEHAKKKWMISGSHHHKNIPTHMVQNKKKTERWTFPKSRRAFFFWASRRGYNQKQKERSIWRRAQAPGDGRQACDGSNASSHVRRMSMVGTPRSGKEHDI